MARPRAGRAAADGRGQSDGPAELPGVPRAPPRPVALQSGDEEARLAGLPSPGTAGLGLYQGLPELAVRADPSAHARAEGPAGLEVEGPRQGDTDAAVTMAAAPGGGDTVSPHPRRAGTPGRRPRRYSVIAV